MTASQQRGSILNQNQHELSLCPKKPNCVSSLSPIPEQHISPIKFPENPEQQFKKLCQIVASQAGTEIQYQDDIYIHVIFRSRLFKFKDDLEFLYDKATKQCNVRSASRSGYYDFGVNRKRIEKIRKIFETGNSISN